MRDRSIWPSWLSSCKMKKYIKPRLEKSMLMQYLPEPLCLCNIYTNNIHKITHRLTYPYAYGMLNSNLTFFLF